MNAIAAMAEMVKAAEVHAEAQSKDRLRAIEYYKGVMTDTPSDAGRSKMATRLVRSHIKKVLPSLMRTLMGSAQIVEFLPIGPEDEQDAEQSTDFMNSVVVPEAGCLAAIEDAIHDALLLRNGILRWWYDERKTVSVSSHTGLNDDAFAQLVAGDDVEVLDHTESEEQTEFGPILVHDARIKRYITKGVYRSSAVPRDRFLIHPDAVEIDESPLVGEKCEYSRSDLVAMGYDKEKVYSLPIADEDDTERDARRGELDDGAQDTHRANQMVDYYDLYIRFDEDDDGIAELRHVVFAGGLTEQHMLLNEECDDVQFCDVKTMSQPHQWEGISLADDLMDLQQGQTVLLRQTLDNLYWANNPQPIIQSGAIKDEQAVYNPEFGLPIVVNQGVDVRAALGTHAVPFVADKSFPMLQYLDEEAQERTGVSDASSGMAPDALQNMTAKASAMIEQAGIGQTELMVRTAARGLEKFFRGLRRMVIRHQDVPRTVRLRGEWAQFDPRQWNAELDCTVNTGLGAGTRERDMIVMQQVLALQEKLFAAFGPDNPFVKPENLYKSITKLVEAAGLKSVEPYFSEPDPQEIQAKMAAAQNKPDPEQAKMQAQMQIEQAKVQAQLQLEQAKMQASDAKEKAQMDADLTVKRAEIEAARMAQTDKLKSDALLLDRKLAWEREKYMLDAQLQRENAERDRQDRIWQAQAQQFAIQRPAQ
jgi:hypothetical protein